MLLRLQSILLLAADWVVGGTAQPTSSSSYPTSAGKWSNLPNITRDRQEHGVALVGDDVYVLGGILPFNGSTYPTTNLVQKYSLRTRRWTTTAPMPDALNHVNVAVVDGKIYYTGGMEATDDTYWNATGASAFYEPSKDKWTVLPPMPAERAVGSAATMVVGDTIYLPGGLRYTNITFDQEGTVPTFTSYNVRTRRWAALADLPAPRDHAGKGRYRDTLYILGGRAFGNKKVVDDVFGYDIKTDRWSTNYARMPTPRGGVASATVGSLMYTAGGEGNPDVETAIYPQMQAYDAARDRWFEYADMSTPLHGTAAVAYKGKVIIPGGAPVTGGEPSPVVLEFTPPRR